MSGYDANFRNTATGDLSTFDGSGNNYGDGSVLNVPPFLEPFMTLACGTTTSWELKAQVGFSFFRTSSLAQNRRYNARQGNFVIDTPGPVDITVTASGFTPFVSFVRNNSVAAQATDGSGVLTYTVAENETGPWTVEVTSLEPYAQGSFDIQISCTSAPFTLTADRSTAARGQKIIFSLVTNDLVNYPPGTSMRVVNLAVPDDNTQRWLFTTDGAGLATIEGWSRTLGDNTYAVHTTLGDFSNIVTVNITAAPSSVNFSALITVLADWCTLTSATGTLNTAGPGAYNSYAGSHAGTFAFDADTAASTGGDPGNNGDPNVLMFSFDNTPQTGSSFFNAVYIKDDDTNGQHYPLGTYTRFSYGGNGAFVPPSTLTIT